jgi:hypothetical protein
MAFGAFKTVVTTSLFRKMGKQHWSRDLWRLVPSTVHQFAANDNFPLSMTEVYTAHVTWSTLLPPLEWIKICTYENVNMKVTNTRAFFVNRDVLKRWKTLVVHKTQQIHVINHTWTKKKYNKKHIFFQLINHRSQQIWGLLICDDMTFEHLHFGMA